MSGIHINGSELYCISVRHSNTNINGLKLNEIAGQLVVQK